jgi:hypothetical protein
MAAPQDFISVSSSATDPATPGNHSQVSTALLQRLRQNNRYLIEWRGPTLSFTWPLDETNEEALPSFVPRIAFATWACFGSFRYYVPDLGSGDNTIRKVDITIDGTVSVMPVRVQAFSLQGSRGQAPSVAYLDATASTITPGKAKTTLSGIEVRGGWNDIFLAVESDADWKQNQWTNNWYIEQEPYPRVRRFNLGDMSQECPPLTNGNVPFVAFRFCTPIAGSNHTIGGDEFLSGTPFTVAYSQIDSFGTSCYGAFLAEVTTPNQIPAGAATDSGYYSSIFWAELGILELRSLSITPYSEHPDRVNDPMLRWYQTVGSNVADVFWQGSRLVDLRHEQVGRAHALQTGEQYAGCWRLLWFTDSATYTQEGREVALSVLEDEPTEDPGDVGIEVSMPLLILAPFRSRPDGWQAGGNFLDFTVELYNITTATVIDTRTVTLPNEPRVVQAGTAVNAPSVFYWIHKMWEETRGANWHDLRPNGQPWSHDGSFGLLDVSTALATTTQYLSIESDTWKSIRQSGDLYCVRTRFTDNGAGNSGAIVALGPITAHLAWGRR